MILVGVSHFPTSYFIEMRDESQYQSSDSSGTYGRRFKMIGLNEDLNFEWEQNVRAALFNNMNGSDNDGAPRQQFNSISKDILSSMVQNFDPQ